VAPENIHTHPKEGYWKFQEGRGVSKAKMFKGKMNQNWNFQRSGVGLGTRTKKPSVARVWIFSGTTHYVLSVS